MNILYFGPYKYNNFLGICSRALVEEISQIDDIKLYTKPIFVNNIFNNRTMINYSGYNRKFPDRFDYIIQHCPIEMISCDMSLSNRHIYIPISDYAINTTTKNYLSNFDDICVDNLMHYKIIKNMELTPQLIDYNIPIKTNNISQINIGINKFKTTFYFIGQYEANINILNKLIVSFILAFRSDPTVALILMLNEHDRESVYNSINQTIKELCNKLNFNTEILPIQTIVQSFSLEDLYLIHNNFDIFIDLSDEYDTGLNYSLAKKYNKTILSIDELDSVVVPYLDSYVYNTRYKYSILTTSLEKKLKDHLLKFKNKQPSNYRQAKTIAEIIK